MNVKQLREKRGISQQELSTKTGIPKDRIAKWEQGKGSPKVDDARKLEAYFKEDVPREKVEEKPDLTAKRGLELGKTGTGAIDYKEKYISLLEKNLADIEERNKEIMLSLADLRRGQNSQTAILRVMQDMLYPLVAEKKKQKPADVRKAASNTALLYFQELEKTGT